MKTTLFFIAALIASVSYGQYFVGDFQTPALSGPETSWYGQDQVTDGDTIYYNNGWNMELSYDSGFGSFTGWSVSNFTDVTTPGWANQFSSITGSGQSSDQYGVCYATDWASNRLFFELTDEPWWDGLHVTNTTYAYLSMLNGDSFAKKFGEDTSATGVIDGTNGEDWFLLTIYSLGLDSLKTGDSVNFYLADFRFADDTEDYIIDEWTWVDLSSLGQAHGLDFVLTSSDTSGGFGMNTPAYFAADNIGGGFASISENKLEKIKAFPNPFAGQFGLILEENATVELVDMRGRLIYMENLGSGHQIIDADHLEAGMYNLIVRYPDSVQQTKIIKE